ncbi:MAG: hypothetical protein U0324_44265 [Polyangiales bacterium]
MPDPAPTGADARRAVAAALVERLTRARDLLLHGFNPDPLHRLSLDGPPEVPAPSTEELSRRAGELFDLRRLLEAVDVHLQLAEGIVLRLHGPGRLVSLEPLVTDYPDVSAHAVGLLERRPWMVPMLVELAPLLRAHYGGAVKLSLTGDLGDPYGGEYLRVVVAGHGLDFDALTARDDAFYEAWSAARPDHEAIACLHIDTKSEGPPGEMYAPAPVPTAIGVPGPPEG